MKQVTIHSLKTHWTFWDKVYERSKTAEIRKNDRGYKVGDWLRLYRVLQGKPGSSLFVEVTDILHLPDALQPDYVMLSFRYPGPDEQKYMSMIADLQGEKAPLPEVQDGTGR